MSKISEARRAIPQNDVGAFYRHHGQEIDAAVAAVLASGWYVLGKECIGFETAFAEAFSLGGAIGVSSGTDAVSLSLMALGIGRGDRVATVSHTAVPTVAAIELAGAEPVLVDIDPVDYTISPAALERTLDAFPTIKAVVVVHLYGQAAAMEEIITICRPRGVRLVEDCAQAHGAKLGDRFVGEFGDLAAFSFYPTKNLAAFGDGGAVSSHDPSLLERVRALRQYGWRQRYTSEFPGINSRLDELQAAILRVKLRHLAAGNARRRAIAAKYTAGLQGTDLVLPVERPDRTHVYHQYVVRHYGRDALAAALKAAGIGTNVHYPVPVHDQPAYSGRLAMGPDGLDHTRAAAEQVLSLPMYPELEDDDVERVIEAVRAAVG